ncbi:mycobactin polyketide synthase MbtD [Mycolicibacterium septicum]|uniref:mycobactin polyketide synthase MbtD n=1 Tax=Mycolicibacterium septicum TaxID=98668 RepID=UPI00235F15FB|nr:mycobactin polyketide synthase MbtD [Mycolicibacterium septicum]
MSEVDALPDGRTPVLLSAHAEDLIGTDAAAILRYLDSRPEVNAGDVAATLLSTRRLRRHRAVVRAADRDELAAGLRALTEDTDHPLVTRVQGGSAASGSSARIAFVFPGQGSQWPSMGVQAYDRLPVYRAEVDKCAAEFDAAGAASPLDYLLADPDSGAVTNDFSQVQIQGAQFVHGVALARVWRSCGVLPDITVGHSLGEIGAAYVAGSISLPEAVAVVVARATVLDRLTGPYRVAVLGITPDEASKVVADTPGWLELSVVNSRSSVAVSGDTDAVAAAVAAVSGRGSFAKEIEMWFPAHTTALDSARADLESMLPAAQFSESPVQFIGSATADVVEAGTGFADYWYTNLRSTVRFDRAIETAARRGARIFVELSAHPALLFAMGDLLDDAAELTGGPVVMVGSGRRDEPITERLSANVVSVAMADTGYRWGDLPNHGATSLRDFPFAPMRTEHLWATPQPLPPVAGVTVGVEHWEKVPPLNAPAGQRRVAVLDLAAGQGSAGALGRAIEEITETTAAAPADADLLVVVAPVSDEVDTVTAAETLSHRIDDGLLGYIGAIAPETRDVWLVTVGGEQVPGDGSSRPEAAALTAMHRSLGYEHPDQTFRHLDLSPGTLGTAAAAVAVTAMLTTARDIALRDNDSGPTLWQRGMRDDTSEVRSWTAESGIFDEVVITGGAGAVGLHYARHLAEQGARRIVLLSRSGLDDQQVAALAAGGAEIIAPRCDLTDPAQIAATIAELTAGPASLVIHAAASATLAPGGELTGAMVRDTFAAKVSGLANLTAAWPLRPDARIVLCSSVSGLWGGYGHAAYSAANRLLDALGGQLRTEGRHCTAVRWGLWPGDGIIDPAEVSRVEKSGLRAMAPDLAVEAGLRDYPADPLVFTADADRLRTFLGDNEERAVAAAGDTPEAAGGDAADTTGAMRIALGSVLKLTDTTALDLDTSLLDLGVDSLLAIDLRKKLKKATGRSVPLATILGGATAAELIGHLERPEKEAFSRD